MWLKRKLRIFILSLHPKKYQEILSQTSQLNDQKAESQIPQLLGQSMDKRLGDMQKLAEELEEAHRFGATKSDYHDAVIDALLDLHPEIRAHPKMREFAEKLQSYMVFKGELKTCATCRYYPDCSVWSCGDVPGALERKPPENMTCGRWEGK